jgi:hypothetical protein
LRITTRNKLKNRKNNAKETDTKQPKEQSGIPELFGKNPGEVVNSLKDIKQSALNIEAKLRDIGMIKGYFNMLAKIQTDMDRHIDNI